MATATLEPTQNLGLSMSDETSLVDFLRAREQGTDIRQVAAHFKAVPQPLSPYARGGQRRGGDDRLSA